MGVPLTSEGGMEVGSCSLGQEALEGQGQDHHQLRRHWATEPPRDSVSGSSSKALGSRD